MDVHSQYNNSYGSLDQRSHDPMLNSFPGGVVSASSTSANYARLSMLVMNEGTQVVAQIVLENLPDYMTLEETVQAKCRKIQSLLDRNIMNMEQVAVLYPETGEPINLERVDLTLWVILMRNVTANAKTMEKHWIDDPKDDDIDVWHDVQRLKKVRNMLAHNGKAEIREDLFVKTWEEVTSALSRLGVTAEVINSYLEKEIDIEQAIKVERQFKNDYITDLRSLLKKTHNWNRKLKLALCMIALTVFALMTLAIMVPVFVKHQCKSCADNIQYANTSIAMIGYLTRKGWGAQSSTESLTRRLLPVDNVIVSVTAEAAAPCVTTDDCCSTVRQIQRFNIEQSHFNDIAYSYVIGGNGIVYIGRGPEYVPAIAYGWNTKSLGIGVTGFFIHSPPAVEVLNALIILLDYLQKTDVLTEDYNLYGLCQVRKPFPYSPGPAFLQVLEEMFPNRWRNTGLDNCFNGTWEGS